jgi:hypothetical protein
MDKQQLLDELKQMAQSGQITQDEALAVFAMPTNSDTMSAHLTLSEVMYYIGSAIVFLGVIVLCYQNWNSFVSPLRILVTLGSAVAAFIVAAILFRYENLKKVSQAFFLLCGLLMPLGLYVTFKEMGVDVSLNNIQVLVNLLLVTIFFSSFYFFRQTILLFFGILAATALFSSTINLIVGQNLLVLDYSKVWEYTFLVSGLAWMLLGYYFKDGTYKAITGVLYGFGSVYFLGAAIFLGGWQPSQNSFWELVYPLLVFGVTFLSVHVKSKAFLVFGSIFLIAYILKLTLEYFSSSNLWPLALVLAGLVIMVVGYYAVRINKKYLSTATVS